MSTWSRWQWYPPELRSEISVSCPGSAALWWLHRSAAYPCSLKRRHDYFLSADETEGAQASLSMSAMFVQITWGVPADRLGCVFMASLSQSRCRQQLKCVISPFPGTLGDVAAPSFAPVLALMCEGEQKVVWLETIAFCWVFRQSSPLNSFTSECVNAGGITKRHGQSMAGSRGVGSNHLFQQQLLLKLSQNNHATTITLTLPWSLLCGVRSMSEAMPFPAGHPPRGRLQRPTDSFTSLRGLNLCHTKLLPQPLTFKCFYSLLYMQYGPTRDNIFRYSC